MVTLKFKEWLMSQPAKVKEAAGGYAIVGCGDRGHPDYQIFGAMSDLKCHKPKKKKKR